MRHFEYAPIRFHVLYIRISRRSNDGARARSIRGQCFAAVRVYVSSFDAVRVALRTIEIASMNVRSLTFPNAQADIIWQVAAIIFPYLPSFARKSSVAASLRGSDSAAARSSTTNTFISHLWSKTWPPNKQTSDQPLIVWWRNSRNKCICRFHNCLSPNTEYEKSHSFMSSDAWKYAITNNSLSIVRSNCVINVLVSVVCIHTSIIRDSRCR